MSSKKTTKIKTSADTTTYTAPAPEPLSPLEDAKVKILAFYEKAEPGVLTDGLLKLDIEYKTLALAWHKLFDEKKVPSSSFYKPNVPQEKV